MKNGAYLLTNLEVQPGSNHAFLVPLYQHPILKLGLDTE